ncbi:bacteriohemerythrin [Roseospira navarrensis]|uniref:Bacteriohemerythrin n=1 Tax=Roseospira navarrensis TaxID=140058 RepID=A0A7X1ZC42_9PROT|nr:bacteriohemerythrin [Roseospira navarrensis]MQX35583.1 bacteriohemerythrin [Roseospira navarrensis]
MAELIVWQESYSVGVPELDSQHKGLIDLINRLSREPANSDLMGWIFAELEAYTKDHFATEEALLKRAGYPDLKTHRREHAAFERWLSAVRQTYAVGVASPSMLSESVNAFLRDWLVRHILGSDMAYKEILSPAPAG